MWQRFCESLRDFIFPPFCQACKDPCRTKLFCPSCWDLCCFPDPLEKCPHCFLDSEGLCKQCRKDPILPFASGYVFEDTEPVHSLLRQGEDVLASFAVCQWAQLDWEMPDVIIPMPGARLWAFYFAQMLRRPLANVFSSQGLVDLQSIDDQLVVLVLDRGSKEKERRHLIESLMQAYPRKGYVLGLLNGDS